MKQLDKVCEDFSTRLPRFFDSTEDWRREAHICWEYYDGHPSEGDYALSSQTNGHYGKLNSQTIKTNSGRKKENAPVITSYINAIVGMMMRDQKRIVAYSSSDQGEVEETAMNKGFRYFDAVTNRNSVKMNQMTYAAVQGIGATTVYLDYTIDGAIAGQPVYEAKEHIFWDRGRGADVDSKTMSWCGYADPVYMGELDEYIERCKEEKGYIGMECPTDFKGKLFEYKDYENEVDIDFLYTYYWREYRKVWDIENPFKVIPEFLLMLTEDYPDAANVFAETAKELQIDFDQSHFTLDTKDYKKLKDLIANIEFMTGQEVPEIEASSRMGRAYYKAEFARGMLLKAGNAYTTQCHPMSFATAYYDKTYGYNYGLGRFLSYYAKMLNESISDLTTYSSRSASGGNVAVKGAADTIAVVKKALEDGHQVVPAKNEMEMQNIGTGDASQAILATNEMILRLIPMSMGMPPELFGMLSTGDMTDSLMNKIRQQMNATLTHLYANMDKSTMSDGLIQRDLIISMAKSITGTLELSFILGGEEGVMELSRQDLARSYTIHLIERDATRDEELESFEKLVSMVEKLPPDQIAQAMPTLIEASPLYINQKKKLVEALTPPPPDPAAMEAQQRQNDANIRLIEAQAFQLENQGLADQARAGVAEREAALTLQSEQADIIETMSKARKNLADVQKSGVDVRKTQIDTLKEVFSPVNNQGV